MMSMPQPTLVVSNLTKTFHVRKTGYGVRGIMRGIVRPVYQDIEAVRGVSFSVNAGERVAFIGPNGAGKSTTIKMLSGILHPTSGDVSLLGHSPWRERQEVARRIGAVFGQRSQLWYHLPAGETFDLLAKIYDIEPAAYRRRLNELVEGFSIGGLLQQPVRNLSLGERMRCEIVASLLHKPQLLFLDEPTIGLDVDAKAKIRDLVRCAAIDDGVSILLTSHDTGDIEQVCDRVIIIDQGRIILDETLQALRARYLNSKRIVVHSADPAPDLGLGGATWLEHDGIRHVLQIDTTVIPAGQVLAALLAKMECSDVTVEDPPMDDIVRRIYATQREAA
jgi:ABC-2 type transport system ATP-binding protein